MADGVRGGSTDALLPNIASREVTYSGDTAKAQAVGLLTFAGADDAKTVADVPAGEGAGATGLRVALATDGTVLGAVNETAPATDTASAGLNGRLQRIAQRLTSISAQLPATLGQKAAAASASVVLASDQGAVPVLATAASDATRSSVAAAAADTALLAASSSRVGVAVFNESASILYVGYGTTAVSLTNYSTQVPAYGLLEVPLPFVQCAIRGYWATATGSARITAG